MAIGARSQAARTYLEKFLDQLGDCDMEELIKHGLRALRDTLPNEVSALISKNLLLPNNISNLAFLDQGCCRKIKG